MEALKNYLEGYVRWLNADCDESIAEELDDLWGQMSNEEREIVRISAERTAIEISRNRADQWKTLVLVK